MIQKYNTLVWGYNNEYVKVIDNLTKNNFIEPKIWFIDAPSENCRINQFSMRDFMQYDNWQEVYADKIKQYIEGIEFDEKIYNYLYSLLFKFIECESRYECHGIKPVHHYVNKFNMLYRFVYSIFVKEKIELCLFSTLMHEGMDFIIYNVAKAMGIKTMLFTQSSIPYHYDRVFYMEDIEDYGDFKFMTNIYDNSEFKLKPTTTEDLFYMKKRRMTFKEMRHYLPFYKKSKYGKFREYKKTLNSFIEKVDYSKKYVYFPLHLQPEMTTSSIGGMYCDQLLAIEKLSNILPDDWYIYVKENPKQDEKQRDYLFFERLKLIKNAKVVPLDENSMKLILNSQFISTITGTAGWEAISHGIPALVFGNTWYQNFEGAFKWYDGINIDTIINKKIDFDKLGKNYSKLLQKMPKCVIDPQYKSTLPNLNEDENINNMTDFHKNVIESFQNIKEKELCRTNK